MVLPTEFPTKSYWIEAAESPLRNFRSTQDLPKEADIVIVGSGYTGASAAYWLHKYTEQHGKRPRIVVLEAGEVCGRATGRNGGQLRPHVYSRYPIWSERLGSDGAVELIRHEMAHLDAFKQLAEEEGITEEVCLKFGETFDAAMTQEALNRLFAAYEKMKLDCGEDDDVVRACRVIRDSTEAERFSQMKGAMGAVVHPTGQIWPYKFVHALLRIVLQTGILNLQAHTPVNSVSEKDNNGFITVHTDRGIVKTSAVLHATNRWASHLLPDFDDLILGSRVTLAAVKAPEGFIRNTGSQHWDSVVNNYHIQLPTPYNAVILGGARQVLVHQPEVILFNDEDDKQFEGVAEFCQSWPTRDVAEWPVGQPGELALPANEGGCWTGIESTSMDAFPFVGPVPNKAGHFMAAGFNGHGMPRILLSTAHLVPLVLASIDQEHTAPALVEHYPPLPKPFTVTEERMQKVKESVDLKKEMELYVGRNRQSAEKTFCREWK